MTVSIKETTSIKLDVEIKAKAKEIFKELGLSMGEAVNIFLTQVTLHKGLPFEVKIPNDETKKAIEKVNKRVLLGVSPSYREEAFKIWAKKGGRMTNEAVVDQYISTLTIKIPEFLKEINSEIQYENLFLCEDKNILEELRLKFLKNGEWYGKMHSTYPSAIKKYMEYL